VLRTRFNTHHFHVFFKNFIRKNIHSSQNRIPFRQKILRIWIRGLTRPQSAHLCLYTDSAVRQRASLLTTLASVGATEMLKTLEVTGLLQRIADGNYTVFAPTNEAFDNFVPQTV